MASTTWPTSGGPPVASTKLDASNEKFEPATPPDMTSTSNASAEPLCSAAGIIEPASAARASVVGWPSASSAQPRGIGSPACAAAFTRTQATADDERSATTGGPSRRGAAQAIGLVPKNGRMPPAGAISDDELANISATSPCSASRSTNQPSTPAEYECVIASTPTPQVLVASTSGSRPASNAGWQKPLAASTTTVPRARPGDERNGAAEHLAAGDVVAVRGQVGQADRAQAVGLGIADAAGGRVGLQRRRPSATQGTRGDVEDLVERQDRADRPTLGTPRATGRDSYLGAFRLGIRNRSRPVRGSAFRRRADRRATRRPATPAQRGRPAGRRRRPTRRRRSPWRGGPCGASRARTREATLVSARRASSGAMPLSTNSAMACGSTSCGFARSMPASVPATIVAPRSCNRRRESRRAGWFAATRGGSGTCDSRPTVDETAIPDAARRSISSSGGSHRWWLVMNVQCSMASTPASMASSMAGMP